MSQEISNITFNQLKKNLKKDFSGFPEIKIAILGDSSTQLLNIALKGFGYEEKLNPNIFEADFAQIENQIYDYNSELYKFKPDFILLFQSSQKLLDDFYGSHDKSKFADSVIKKEKDFWKNINSKIATAIIHCNFNEINDSVFGNYANKTEESFIYQLRKINFELMNISRNYGNVFINDVCSLYNLLGAKFCFDEKNYVTSKIVFSVDFHPYLAKNIIDIIKAVKGRINKCLILDLDNTLWGGVIGDDGMNNIQIGDFVIGNAFTDFQKWLKQLKERGIILAVCSKNYEDIAKEPFLKHPDMVLKLDDIAVFVANWENKVDNIKYIKSVLNIGFDSMVFIDDYSFERNMVRSTLPEITVPELPEDPSEYLSYLRNLNLFETATLSGEDTKRTQQYQEEAKRIELQKGFTNIDEYLESLEMKAVVKPFEDFYVPRIAQLTQRSNQYNLRTIRYSEEDIFKIMKSAQYLTLFVTLEDKFGDYGLISLIILEKKQDIFFIDTWLMSCRVLKRGVENLLLNKIVDLAKENNIKKIIGEYITTQKNELVKEHYKNLEFIQKNNLWELLVTDYKKHKYFISEK
ncbi:MAG: HAD-IIIC family phosphatase [Bacteroidales bacterium]|jgi:FkbH-like protein